MTRTPSIATKPRKRKENVFPASLDTLENNTVNDRYSLAFDLNILENKKNYTLAFSFDGIESGPPADPFDLGLTEHDHISPLDAAISRFLSDLRIIGAQAQHLHTGIKSLIHGSEHPPSSREDAMDFGLAAQDMLNTGLDPAVFDQVVSVLPLIVQAINKNLDVRGILDHILSGDGAGPVAAAADINASLPPEAEALFGNVPALLSNIHLHTRSSFPDAWFSNEAVILAANQLAGSHDRKVRKGQHIELTDAELERVRTARRFLKQLQRRRKGKAARPIKQPKGAKASLTAP